MRRPKKRSTPKAITPVWAAQRIGLETQKDLLLIRGWGCILSALETRKIEPGRISELDILQGFRRYALRNLGKGQTTGDAGVYQFADATDDEKLIAFCGEFGPVYGEVRSKRYEDDDTYTLTVAQDLERLRDEQKRFAATVRLIQQVNKSAQADRSIMLQAMQDTQMYQPETLSDVQEIIETLLEPDFSDTPSHQKTAEFLPFAHLAVCGMLNEFPPQLVPAYGGVVELPRMQDEGIRDALYFQLRRDYMAQREIGTCLHCGGHFPVYKHGTQGCSQPCRRALRNQKYWNKSKATINAERREKNAERK